MYSNFDLIILDEFPSDKIIKLINRFNIKIPKDDLESLINNSISIQQVIEQLISDYRPTKIIKSNLWRYIKRYWDLNFSTKLYVEKVNTELYSLIFADSSKQNKDVIIQSQGALDNVINLLEEIGSVENLQIFSEFTMILKSWLFYFLLQIFNLDNYPNKIKSIISDLKSIIDAYYSSYNDIDLQFACKLTQTKVLYFTGEKAEGLSEFQRMREESEIKYGFVVLEGLILTDNLDERNLNNFLSNVSNLITDKNLFTEIIQIDDFIKFLQNISKKCSKVYSTQFNEILTSLKELKKNFSQKQENNTLQLSDEIVSISHTNYFPAILFSSKTLLENILANYKYLIKDLTLTEFFMKVLNKEIPLQFSFICTNCAIIYSENFNQILLPPNWNEAMKNMKSDDNGFFIFNKEILCQVCSSFKFQLHTYSKLLLANIVSYVTEKKGEIAYDLSKFENPIVLVSLVSKYFKKAKTVDLAIQQIDSLLKKNSKESKYYHEKGKLMLYLNNYSEAKKHFATALALNSEDINSVFNLLKIAYGRKQFEQCKKLIYQLMDIVNNHEEMFLPNYDLLLQINGVVSELKDSKLTKTFKKFLQE